MPISVDDADNDRIFNPDSLAVVGPLLEDSGSTNASAAPEKVDTVKVGTTPKITQAAKAATPIKMMPKKRQAAKPPSNALLPSKVMPAMPEKIIAAQEPALDHQRPSFGTIKGEIILLGAKNQVLPSNGVLLNLKSLKGNHSAPTNRSMTHRVDMQNKTYLPRYLTIRKGDSVSFVNKDNIKHNVFSPTGKNAFDLGTYSAGKKRDVALQEEGVVKVYCNIHAEMATFISVSDSGLSASSTEDGKYLIEAIPPGDYELYIWHIRGEKTQKVSIKKYESLTVNVTLETTKHKAIKHQNKYGKKYSKNNSIFDDEFY